MTESYDVVIVGAGIIGAAVAAAVAQQASVLLLEAESELAVHSTGRSAAMLTPPTLCVTPRARPK